MFHMTPMMYVTKRCIRRLRSLNFKMRSGVHVEKNDTKNLDELLSRRLSRGEGLPDVYD